MSLLTRLERALGRLALNDLSLYLVVGQLIVLALAMFGGFDVERIMLQPGAVLTGQWWRPFTFIFVPPVTSISMTGAIFLAFGWYLFYLMGSALEHHWGVFRFNAFIFLGWALTVGVSFITPLQYATNGYIAATVFLAFAYLNPDFVMYIFFVLPVKIKWLALLQWLGYAYLVATGGLAQRLMVLASVGNFLCFFSRDIVLSIKSGRRRMEWQAQQFGSATNDRDPRHRCVVCGKTDVTAPTMDFRYCSKCANDECYCADHIGSHEHTVAAPETLSAMAAQPRTLGDWLSWAERQYARRKVALGQVATTAHDEALYLLLRTLDLPLDSKPAVLRRKLTAEETARVTETFRRRLKEHVPAAYLTREAWLGEHRFYVDERVIIPRSYFLEIIPEQLPHWLPPQKPVKRAVDVCTGSGCLAILLAHQFPTAKVDAIELSPDAAAVAKFNIAAHHLAARVKLFHSDVFDAVPRAKYDLILSNPPYVPTRELRDLPAEFKNEPQMALDGGRDGLDIIRKLLRQSRDRLQPHGIVVLEVGGLRAAMDRAFPELDLHWLHTADGEDCVCLVQAARLRDWKG